MVVCSPASTAESYAMFLQKYVEFLWWTIVQAVQFFLPLLKFFQDTMTYQETIEYLFNQLPVFQKEGASAYKPGLDTIHSLDASFSHPHFQYPSIHVAGTNGKGSVSHLTASVLQEAGLRVGLFTSPHLKDFRERIRVNGALMPEQAVTDFVERYLHSDATSLKPSFFELTTMMAFDWFAKEHVDVAVIEVGLGGRLDSTNIIQPLVSVITNISFDHMALLGNDLVSIAGEKAGIIKPGIPVVVGRAEHEIRDVFRQKAYACGSPLHYAADRFRIDMKPSGELSLMDIYEDGCLLYIEVPCALNGWYQSENVATVLTLLRLLPESWSVSEKHLRNGFQHVIRNTGLHGRWETLSVEPRIICDTGHNEGGIRFVVQQLKATPYERLHVVIGMVNDKDCNTVLSLLPKDAVYYFTKAAIPRALPEETLAGIASEHGLKGNTYPSVKAALDAAKKECRPNDLIFVGGSTFIVAEAI